MVKHVLFPNLRESILLLCFVLMFCFSIENNYFVVHSESRNLKYICFFHLNTTPMSNSCKLWLIFDETAAILTLC